MRAADGRREKAERVELPALMAALVASAEHLHPSADGETTRRPSVKSVRTRILNRRGRFGDLQLYGRAHGWDDVTLLEGLGAVLDLATVLDGGGGWPLGAAAVADELGGERERRVS